MSTLRSRFSGAWNALSGGGQAATLPVSPPANPAQQPQPTTTGPLNGEVTTDGQDAQPVNGISSYVAHIRSRVEAFEEDKEAPLGAFILAVIQVACYIIPLILAVAVAYILADVFTGPGINYNSMLIICLCAEITQAACVLALPRGIAGFKRDATKRAATLAEGSVFVFLVIASVLAQYIVLSQGRQLTGFTNAMILTRSLVPVFADIGCTFALVLFRKKTLAKFLEETEKKEKAVIEVSLAELRLQETEQDSEMRAKERREYLEGKQRQNDMLVRLQELQNGAIIRVMEEAVNDRDRVNGNGNQRRLGGGSSY